MIKKILLILVVVILGLVAVIASRPSDFEVKRSAEIPAPPAVVFGHVADLHKFQAWSPWAKMDPDAKTTFNGSGGEIGSSFSWAGKQTGEGTMTLRELQQDRKAVYSLDFRKPFKGTNAAVFDIEPSGSGSKVTWTMTGKNNFISKGIGLFIDMDKMIGDQFEKGLADMKRIAESQP